MQIHNTPCVQFATTDKPILIQGNGNAMDTDHVMDTVLFCKGLDFSQLDLVEFDDMFNWDFDGYEVGYVEGVFALDFFIESIVGLRLLDTHSHYGIDRESEQVQAAYEALHNATRAGRLKCDTLYW